jgi:hypothetical protein
MILEIEICRKEKIHRIRSPSGVASQCFPINLNLFGDKSDYFWPKIKVFDLIGQNQDSKNSTIGRNF